jgi:hypothetical protein
VLLWSRIRLGVCANCLASLGCGRYSSCVHVSALKSALAFAMGRAYCQSGSGANRGGNEMKRTVASCFLISGGIACLTLAGPAAATTPTFAYVSNVTCLNSTSGFNSNFEPNTPGTGSTTTFSAVGSGSVSGSTSTAMEYDVFVVSDDKKAPASAGAATVNITSTVTGPNGDGSYTLTPTSFSGSFTSGPRSGLTFTVSGVAAVKMWIGSYGNVFGVPTTAVQTVSLSNGTSFERVCTTTNATISLP